LAGLLNDPINVVTEVMVPSPEKFPVVAEKLVPNVVEDVTAVLLPKSMMTPLSA